jgi:hypothetical protein
MDGEEGFFLGADFLVIAVQQVGGISAAMVSSMTLRINKGNDKLDNELIALR